MYAYRLPQAASPIDAAEHPSMRRLLPAGPWQYAPHPHGGTMVSWRDPSGRTLRIDDYGAPRETADGLVYYPPKEAPTAAMLLRKTLPPESIVVELASGVSLPIALAIASPRKLVFTPVGIEEGDYLTEYARLSDQLREKVKADGDAKRNDPLLHRVVLLAIQQTLRATEEALTDCGCVSTIDFMPIVAAGWGVDPKATGADVEPSSSPAPASPTSL